MSGEEEGEAAAAAAEGEASPASEVAWISHLTSRLVEEDACWFLRGGRDLEAGGLEVTPLGVEGRPRRGTELSAGAAAEPLATGTRPAAAAAVEAAL